MSISIKITMGAIPLADAISQPVRCQPWQADAAGARTAFTLQPRTVAPASVANCDRKPDQTLNQGSLLSRK